MAAPASLPDVTMSRVEKNPMSHAAAKSPSDQERGSFERVRKDVSRADKTAAGKPESGRGKTAGREKDKPQAAQEKAAEPTDAKAEAGREADAVSAPGEAAVASDGTPASADRLDDSEAVFALLSPAPEPVSRGNPLPVSAAPPTPSAPIAGLASSTEGQSNAVGLRQMFMQMIQGEAGGKAGAATQDAGGKALGEIDLQSFKSSLAEAVDARGGRPSDAPGTAMMTSQRGLEVREGSALVRQYSTTVDTPVQQGDWGDKMAGKISWLANQRISFAEIHINPPDMGPVEVRVSVQNDQASVTLHAQNSSVRDLLELNGNRLRDMLQENGLDLAKMDVSDQTSRQQQQMADGESGQGGRDSRDDTEEPGLVSLDGEAISTGEIHLQWQSQVDTYA
jgi:flagellar hook-length control protein FliK